MNWWNRLFGDPVPTTQGLPPKPKPEGEPLFIENRTTLVATITSAKKEFSKASGTPFVRCELTFSGRDDGVIIINRFEYSRLCTQYGWPPYDEEGVIKSWVGRQCRVRCIIKCSPGPAGKENIYYNEFRIIDFVGVL